MPGAGSIYPRGSMWWQEHAACQWQEPRLFDPVRTKPGSNERQRILDAKAVCAGCPVKVDCLEFAIANGESGVRGGEYVSAGRVLYISKPDRPRPRRAA